VVHVITNFFAAKAQNLATVSTIRAGDFHIPIWVIIPCMHVHMHSKG